MSDCIELKPVAFVRSRFKVSEHKGLEWFETFESEIEILPEFSPALEGLIERYRTVAIVFFFDRCTETKLVDHPHGDKSREKRGVFSMCCPSRPNHIGLTFSTLVGRRGNTLIVRGLDALDGTPILDIRPGEKNP